MRAGSPTAPWPGTLAGCNPLDERGHVAVAVGGVGDGAPEGQLQSSIEARQAARSGALASALLSCLAPQCSTWTCMNPRMQQHARRARLWLRPTHLQHGADQLALLSRELPRPIQQHLRVGGVAL